MDPTPALVDAAGKFYTVYDSRLNRGIDEKL
jgi:hypothetical protein